MDELQAMMQEADATGDYSALGDLGEKFSSVQPFDVAEVVVNGNTNDEVASEAVTISNFEALDPNVSNTFTR